MILYGNGNCINKIMQMKEIIKTYKLWKRWLIRNIAKWYANSIIKKIDSSNNYQQFEFWINKGILLDEHMIDIYDIYLD